MMQNMIGRYLQYSKRIALFGIIQWAVLALASLMIVLMYGLYEIRIDDFASSVINNIVTCSSALAVAICSGYYAHSAYDNNLKQKVESVVVPKYGEESSTETGNG